MSFRFRLERVLSVRRIQEEAAQQRHAEALARCRRAEACLSGLSQRLEQALDDLDRLKHRDELTPEALYLHSLHLSGLRREIQLGRFELAAASEQADKAAAELLEAHRATETLEKLRERDENAWREKEARRESRDIDEMAVSRHRAREEENHGP